MRPLPQTTYWITVKCLIQLSEEERLTIQRDAVLPILPRVGDYLFAESWGLVFDGEGVEVESVAVGLEDCEIIVWIPDDLESWRDMEEWGDADNMIRLCYSGFKRSP